MHESKYRRILGAKLNADIVTSLDRGGCRRFRSRRTGKWGYCDNDGDVICPSQFDTASHFNEVQGVYEVQLAGKKLFFDESWAEWRPDELVV
jgi:hypothetical protein